MTSVGRFSKEKVSMGRDNEKLKEKVKKGEVGRIQYKQANDISRAKIKNRIKGT